MKSVVLKVDRRKTDSRGRTMYTFIIYVGISLVIFFILEWFMRRKLNIPYKQRTALRDRFRGYKWIERGFWALFFVNLTLFDSEWITTTLILLFFTFEVFIQWKYNRSDNEYIISLIGLIFFVLFIGVGNIFGYF
jgi:Domain of unknown function (DUF4181)